MNTIPESPETIEAQLDWLREGKRKAVLLTPGCVLPELEDKLGLLVVPEGVLVFRKYDPAQAGPVWQYRNGRISLADLLGYGIPAKPENVERSTLNVQRSEPARVVVVRGPDGHEKQTVVTDSERLDAVHAAAQAVKDAEDTVTIEDAGRVLCDRLKSLDARELKVRPYRPEQDEQALAAAARADQHCPLNPTHVIERHGQVVGYFGCSSLPLYRLWFHSRELKASDSLRLLFMIENHYRMAGVETLGTIINTGSPFYPVAVRGGYLESGGDRLFLKDL